MKNKIEFIAFDADDTLWENELYFQELEHKFCHLLRKYSPAPSVSEELFKTLKPFAKLLMEKETSIS